MAMSRRAAAGGSETPREAARFLRNAAARASSQRGNSTARSGASALNSGDVLAAAPRCTTSSSAVSGTAGA